MSGHDLELLVCSSVSERLIDQQFILSLAGDDCTDADQLRKAIAEADLVAATLRSGCAHAKAELLDALVQQIRLFEDRVEVEFDVAGARARLKMTGDGPLDVEAAIATIPAVRVRRGHQLRLIVPGPDATNCKPVRRDEKLVTLIAEAQLARQLVLSQPGHSLARIASGHGRCRTRLGTLVALSCLATEIVSAIVQGQQPDQLTAASLLSSALPLSWSDQRRALGFR